MINRILSRVITRPVLFLVVYDEVELTFSRPHPGAVAKAVAEQPVWWSPIARARLLLKPANDKVTVITYDRLFHSELREDVGREYIFVSGYHFSFKTRLGRDNFDPKTDDLVLKFGEPDGQYAQSMIEHCLPRVLAKVA
jgi:hypothetical protein